MKRADLSTLNIAWLISLGVIAELVLLTSALRLIILSDPPAEMDVSAYL